MTQPVKSLLVEDNEDTRIVYSSILRPFGYKVTDALHGEDLNLVADVLRERLRRFFPQLSDTLDLLTGNTPVVGVTPYETLGQGEEDEED